MDTAAKVFAQFQLDFMIPMAGYRTPDGSLYIAAYGYYWSSSPYADSDYSYYLYFGSSLVRPQLNFDRGYGFSLRCFQNSVSS
jgi:hypothetical protein